MNVPQKKPKQNKGTQNRGIQKSDTSVIKIDLRRTFNTWNEMSEIIFNMTSRCHRIYIVVLRFAVVCCAVLCACISTQNAEIYITLLNNSSMEMLHCVYLLCFVLSFSKCLPRSLPFSRSVCGAL